MISLDNILVMQISNIHQQIQIQPYLINSSMADEEFKQEIGLFTFYKLQEKEEGSQQFKDNKSKVFKLKRTLQEGIKQKTRIASSLITEETQSSRKFSSNHDRFKASEQFLKNIPHKLHKPHCDRLNDIEKSLIGTIHLKTDPSIMMQKRQNLRVTIIDEVINPNSMAVKLYQKGTSKYAQRMQLLHINQASIIDYHITSRRSNKNQFALHSLQFKVSAKGKSKEGSAPKIVQAQRVTEMNNEKQSPNKPSEKQKKQKRPSQVSHKSFIQKIKFLQTRNKKELLATPQINSLSTSKTAQDLNQANKKYLNLLINAHPDGSQTAARILRQTLKFPKIIQVDDPLDVIHTEGSSNQLKHSQRQNDIRSFSCSKKEINIRQSFQKNRQPLNSNNQNPVLQKNIYRNNRKSQKNSKY